jgi:pimeloyl-ACP methyl ester carboxylesterase
MKPIQIPRWVVSHRTSQRVERSAGAPFLFFAIAILCALPDAARAQKRAVIWLHGHPGSARSSKIDRLTKKLKKHGIPVYAPDLNTGKLAKGPKANGKDIPPPPTGEAPVRFTVSRALRQVRTLIKREQIDEVVLVGHSMGGLVAATAASHRHAKRSRAKIKGLALLAAAFDTPLDQVHGRAARRDMAHHAPYPVVSADIPVVLFHALTDDAVPVDRSKTFVEKRRAQKARETKLQLVEDDHIFRQNGKRIVDDIAGHVLEHFGLAEQSLQN